MSYSEKFTTSEELFRQKADARRESAARTVEEKIETLVKLQKLTKDVARAAGRSYKEPWNIKPAIRT
ncbi:hypothetical protein BH10CYA1_BH10CYA1_01000 [soil metagenome]